MNDRSASRNRKGLAWILAALILIGAAPAAGVPGLSVTASAAGETYSVEEYGEAVGSVLTDKTEAAEGETVTLTVLTENDYRLKRGSLAAFWGPKSLALTLTPGAEANTWTFRMPAGHVLVLAEFEAAFPRVTFVNDDGTPFDDIPVQDLEEGERAAKPVMTATRENCEFAGWYINVGGAFQSYNFSTPVTENLTLTAKWRAKPVTITEISASAGSVALSWQASPVAESYRVHRRGETGGWLTVGSGLTDTSFTDTTAKAGKTYFYTVRAYRDGVYSTNYRSTERSVTVPYGTPRPVTIDSIDARDGSVVLSWNGLAGAESYRVHRRLQGGSWTTVAAAVTGTTFTDSGAKAGKTYEYTVRSCIGGKLSSGYNDTVRSVTIP